VIKKLVYKVMSKVLSYRCNKYIGFGGKEMGKDKSKYIQLEMDIKYREKRNCLLKAEELISNNIVKGMSNKKLAKEIFAHAVAYYNAEDFGKIPIIGRRIYNYLIKHANPIDIVDGGDTFIRKLEYNIVWLFFR